MATNPCVPFWDEGNTFTGRAGEAITGCRFVSIMGARIDGHPQVGHTVNSATVRAVGVSGYDAASGADVTVYAAPGLIVPVLTAAAITAGDLLYSDANGKAVKVAPTGALPIAVAMDDAADATLVPAKLL